MLFCGVAAACALGAGLGLWARPALHERQAAGVAPPEQVEAPPPTTRKLQIVVDDRPLPAAAPIQVLPAAAAEPPRKPLFDLPSMLAPKRPPEGLIRAEAVLPPTAPKPVEVAHPQALKVVVPAVTAAAKLSHPDPEATREAKLQVAKAEAAKAQAAKVKLAKAEAARAAAHRLQLAREAKAEAAKAEAVEVRLALAQAAKAQAAKVQLAKAQLARKAANHSEQLRLAAAEAHGRAEAMAEARQQAREEALADSRKRARLAAMAHVLARALPHRAPPVEVAKADTRRHAKRAHEVKVEQAALKTRREREPARVAVHPQRARPEPVAPTAGNGLMRVSTTPRCARSDPGEALVCADPGLSAADRQLTRAYQGARAAGVPDAQLRSQQQRWLAARSAAARDAPWAVRDVYMARIAELNGQAREAQSGY